ncbi:MAG: YIP1 family protein [Deltaproteobacteria bacterium]|nr:YIP1 family protein [Deltaproteobacteria bacterium]
MTQGEELAASSGFVESETQPDSSKPLPWEDPDEPRWTGFWRTLREALFHPRRLFQAPGERWQEPLAFGLIVGTVGLAAVLYWQLLLSLALSRLLDGAWVGAASIITGKMKFFLALMVLAPVLTLANMELNGLCLWGAANLAGCRTKFVPVWRIISYSQAGMAAALVPLLGGLVAPVWVIYLIYKGIKTAFGLSTGRALGTLAIFVFLEGMALFLLMGSLLGFLGLLGLWLFWGLN